MVYRRTIGNCENWFVIYPSEPLSHTSSTDMLLQLKSYNADSADAWKLDQDYTSENLENSKISIVPLKLSDMNTCHPLSLNLHI